MLSTDFSNKGLECTIAYNNIESRNFQTMFFYINLG